MIKLGPLTCGARLVRPGDDYRVCVLHAGHYVEKITDPFPMSWHKSADGQRWADYAEGACPSGVTVTELDPNALTADVLPGYRAQVSAADLDLAVSGPAKFVAGLIRAFADAFEEEAER